MNETVEPAQAAQVPGSTSSTSTSGTSMTGSSSVTSSIRGSSETSMKGSYTSMPGSS